MQFTYQIGLENPGKILQTCCLVDPSSNLGRAPICDRRIPIMNGYVNREKQMRLLRVSHLLECSPGATHVH
jgi:hypothetical protein